MGDLAESTSWARSFCAQQPSQDRSPRRGRGRIGRLNRLRRPGLDTGNYSFRDVAHLDRLGQWPSAHRAVNWPATTSDKSGANILYVRWDPIERPDKDELVIHNSRSERAWELSSGVNGNPARSSPPAACRGVLHTPRPGVAADPLGLSWSRGPDSRSKLRRLQLSKGGKNRAA